MIEINGVYKSFKDKEVLKNINLKIDNGKVLGLCGINGAGKSTLLRIVTGVYKADSGNVVIDGEDIYDNENVKKSMYFLPDEPYYDLNSTPESIIKLYQNIYDVDIDCYYKHIEHFKIPLKKKIIKFSKGMKRQMFISIAFALKPKYLILDEAFDGLDPFARLYFKREIVDMVSDINTTVIIASHSLRELEDICDSFAIIDKNEIASSGELYDSLEKIHKYQIAFNEKIDKDSFPKIYKSFHQDERVVRIVTNMNSDEVMDSIKELNPIFIDELPINFEEMFNAVIEEGGYLEDEKSN